ncbi:MAG: class I SAM-dependent methyltransferase [Promethearchaeota archaeon]|nr:MAG: class I SAM-dependent methyltransferase [Candidatus Lokiarchaeota archaeon]
MKKRTKTSNKKKRIIDDYNSSAHFYDRRYRQIQLEKYDLILNNYHLNGKIISDIGCGTGLLFEYISNLKRDEKRVKYKFVAIDISWNMLLEFKSKVENYKTKNNLELILGDIENLPFRGNTFHSIFSLTSFQNLPYLKKGLRESFKVCKNNADFRFSILKKSIDLKNLKDMLKLKIKNPCIINEKELEDFVIVGKVSNS